MTQKEWELFDQYAGKAMEILLEKFDLDSDTILHLDLHESDHQKVLRSNIAKVANGLALSMITEREYMIENSPKAKGKL